MVTTCHVPLTKSLRLKIQPLNLITQVAVFTLWFPLIKLKFCVSQHKAGINRVSFEITIRGFLSLQYLISSFWRPYPYIVSELSLLLFFLFFMIRCWRSGGLFTRCCTWFRWSGKTNLSAQFRHQKRRVEDCTFLKTRYTNACCSLSLNRNVWKFTADN